MNKLTSTFFVISITMFVAACDQSSSSSQTASKPAQAAVQQASEVLADQGKMDHSNIDHSKTDQGEMDHSKMDHSTMAGETGHSSGTIVAIIEDGQQVVLDHEAIDGVGMAAMTMGFAVLSSIDLNEYAIDDNVSFMVKKGRDGSYRITKMCNINTDGAECLNAIMDHSAH